MIIHNLWNKLSKFKKINKLKKDKNRRSNVDPTHHWIFDEFKAFIGDVPTNFHVAYIGDRVRDDTVDWEGHRPNLKASPSKPPFDEEYFEWIDTLEAVKEAGNQFIMFEIGAGYGRWTARAAWAARQAGKDYRFGLAEADPKHQKLLKQNMEDNDIALRQYKLFGSAVSDSHGECLMLVRMPEALRENNWFGQAINAPDIRALTSVNELYDGVPILQSRSGAAYIYVKKITLSDILSEYDDVDVINMDIQGEEAKVIKESVGLLTQKVHRLHIGTHSHAIENQLRRVLRKYGWLCLRDYSCGQVNETEFGRINFIDGVQSWININKI